MTTRRQILAGGALAAGLAATPAIANAAGDARPNILWLVSEDNNPWYGCYGDRLAHTPNIDALARQGVLYKRAYSTAPVCAPSRFALLTGVHPQSCAPAQHMRANAVASGILPIVPDLMRKAGYYCTNNAKTDYNCDVEPGAVWDECSPKAHWKNRPAGKPFFAMVTWLTTHESQGFKPTPGKVQPADVRVPAYLPDAPAIRSDIASYYNRIELMDAQVGAALAELEAAGLADDTIVFHFSDNGGILPGSKRYCREEGMRTSLIIRIPPKWSHLAPTSAGGVIETPVSQIDLPPTLMALAGLSVPKQMQGKSLMGGPGASKRAYAFGARDRMDERYDFVRTVSDGRYRYIRNYLPHLPTVQNQAFSWLAAGYQEWDKLRIAGRLTPEQRTMFGPRSFEELYDLDADPDQMTNLAEQAAHSNRLNSLRRALDAHMIAINDNGFIPEGSRLQGYVPSRVKEAYPLKRLMGLAQAAARRDRRKTALFAAALDDANEAVRYWGAMGFAMSGREAASALPRLKRLMNADPVAQVRIAAAEAVAVNGEPSEAVAALANMLAPDQDNIVRLQAVNLLTRLGEAARPTLPQLKALMAIDNEYLPNASTFAVQMLEGTYDPARPIFANLERLMRPPTR